MKQEDYPLDPPSNILPGIVLSANRAKNSPPDFTHILYFQTCPQQAKPKQPQCLHGEKLALHNPGSPYLKESNPSPTVTLPPSQTARSCLLTKCMKSSVARGGSVQRVIVLPYRETRRDGAKPNPDLRALGKKMTSKQVALTEYRRKHNKMS